MKDSRAVVVGTAVDTLSFSSAVDRVIQLATEGTGRHVCICNVHMVITAVNDSELRDSLAQADLVTPDGAPIAWVAGLLRRERQERISGPDLMNEVLCSAERMGLVVSFYGSTEITLHSIREKLHTLHPRLKVGALISPPFGPSTNAEIHRHLDEINSHGTNILLVGLGCPKQEKWMLHHKSKLNCVMLGVGAAFDFYAGTVTRAPLWMRVNGLEWLHRLFSEPRRLWKRYLVTNTLFVYHAARQLIAHRFKGT